MFGDHHSIAARRMGRNRGVDLSFVLIGLCRTPGPNIPCAPGYSEIDATNAAGPRGLWPSATPHWFPCPADARAATAGRPSRCRGFPTAARSICKTLSVSPRPGMVARLAGLATATSRSSSNRIVRPSCRIEYSRSPHRRRPIRTSPGQPDVSERPRVLYSSKRSRSAQTA